LPATELWRQLESFVYWLASFDDISDTILRTAVRELVETCLDEYKQNMKPLVDINPPETESKYLNHHTLSISTSTDSYERGGRNIETEPAFKEGEKDLLKTANREFFTILERRETRIVAHCMEIAEKIWNDNSKHYDRVEDLEEDKKKIREIFFAQTLCEGVHEQTWQLRLRSLEAIEKQIQGNFQKELVSAFAIIILLICFLSRSGIPFLIFALLTAWSILVILGNSLPTTIVKIPRFVSIITTTSNENLGPALFVAYKQWEKYFPEVAQNPRQDL